MEQVSLFTADGRVGLEDIGGRHDMTAKLVRNTSTSWHEIYRLSSLTIDTNTPKSARHPANKEAAAL